MKKLNLPEGNAICPNCASYFDLRYHRELIRCPQCHEKLLSRSKFKIDWVAVMNTIHGFEEINTKIQQKIKEDPTFLDRYKELVPLLKNHGIKIPNSV